MKKTGEELEKVVYGFWANRFGCKPEDFSKAGTLFIKDEEIAGSGTVILYHVDKMSIVRISPSLAKQAGIQDKFVDTFTAQGIQSLFGDGYQISVTSTFFDSYLDPKDFRFFSPKGDFPARRLDSEKDKSILLSLYNACTEEDLDAADIYVDEPNPVIFGLFADEQLVAYASHRYWGEDIADIGVLIHPAYRSRGLGKAVVSELCAWCIQNKIVPMYRVFSDHEHSRRIPLALVFKDMVIIESLKLIREQNMA